MRGALSDSRVYRSDLIVAVERAEVREGESSVVIVRELLRTPESGQNVREGDFPGGLVCTI